MKLLLFILIILLINKIHLYLVDRTSSYIIIDSQTYLIELIPPKEGLYYDSELNQISEKNYFLYYVSIYDDSWKKYYGNPNYIFYIDSIETYNNYISELTSEKRINHIIIGVESVSDINNIKATAINNKYIFINKNKEEIKKKYSYYEKYRISSMYINFFFAGDIISDNFIIIVGIFLIVYLVAYMIIYCFAKKTEKRLFIHDYILITIIFYFFHTLLFYLITMKKKYKYYDENVYSGFIFYIFNFFQFMVKILVNIYITIQINIFEIREHSRIISNSKVVHLLACNIIFIITLQTDNPSMSEFLNCLLYFLAMISLSIFFSSYKNTLKEKYEDAINNEPEYIPTLTLKKKLLHIHYISFFAFIVIHFLIYFIFNKYFTEYKTQKFIFIFINYSELIPLLIISVLYYPRKLPEDYIEEYRDNDNVLDEVNIEENSKFRYIYNYEINKKEQDEELYFNNYKKDINNGNNIFIIENPFSDIKYEENININNNINNNKENQNSNNNIEEEPILVKKNDEENIIEDNNNEGDILDFTHTKLGFVDIYF